MRIRSSLFLALFLAGFSSVRAATFTDIISFGDSLTDVGNVAGVTVSGTAPVAAGYYESSRFSNGPLWVENLAAYWKLPARTPGRSNTTTLPPQTGGNDWAWGGSESGTGTVQPVGVTQPIPNLLTEVAQYLATNRPAGTTLYTIWSGADNLLVGGKYGPQAAADAAAAVKTAIEELAAAGARNFLVFNIPKLGETPKACAGGLQYQSISDGYADSFNVALDSYVEALRKDASFAGKIRVVDVYAELVTALNSVQASGTYTPSFFVPGAPVTIRNATEEALTVYRASGTMPHDYLFWDDVHPTAEGHQIIAGLAVKAFP